ncbi:hypothetical protein R1sor_000575 [Riccia sorocarpa]|uniref:DDE Tnp4 domain-containing protein n=1 Tax=Riccia sorocarpa TaxID=122646 RepID=A0ABD3GUC2_9MARC
MDRHSFFQLLSLIENHSVFQNESTCSQAPVIVQLAATLDRFGHEGNGACVGRSLFHWGIGVGTLVKYTYRVITALEDALSQEVVWPNREERRRISSAFSLKGFPGCVELIDGTLLKLSQRPKKDGETYFDSKRNYSLNAEIVCDDKRRIIYFFSGMPGSCADSTCLRRPSLYEKLKTDIHISSQFFDSGQYLLADSGYVPLPHLVCAYRNAAGCPEKEVFNTCLAKVRVINEHVIGVLKSQWFSLREIRIQLKNQRQNKYAMRWISCCIRLHNFLNGRDDWTEQDGPIVIETDDLSEPDEVLDDRRARERGINLRNQVQSTCFHLNNDNTVSG